MGLYVENLEVSVKGVAVNLAYPGYLALGDLRKQKLAYEGLLAARLIYASHLLYRGLS